MYLDYYHLREYPFTLASDPRFLYFSDAHKEAMAGLLYALCERKGVALLVGEPGTGKTTVLRAVLEMLPGEVRAQTLDTPLHPTPEALLGAVLEGFGVEPGAGMSARLRQFESFLRVRHAAGDCVLLIVDEAQDLNPLVLEQVRLLSNLESGGHKLLQIILSGQPELREHLRSTAGRALEQRVAVRCHLAALDAAQVDAYLRARMERAGGAAAVFEPAAMARVAAVSGGVPRLINIVADHALLAGFAAQTPRISAALVERAAVQLDLAPADAPAPAAVEPAPTRRDWIRTASPAPAAVPEAPPAVVAPAPAQRSPRAVAAERPPVLERFVRGWGRWPGLMRTRPGDVSGTE